MASVADENEAGTYVYIKDEPGDAEFEEDINLPGTFKDEVEINEDVMIKEEVDEDFIEEEASSNNGEINFQSVFIKEEISLPDFDPEMEIKMEEENDSNEVLSAKQVLFNCSQCKKTFKRKNGLIKHMEIHSGANLYRCQECSKYFTHFEFLLKHMQNIHKKEKPYHDSVVKKQQFQCYYCEKAFDLVSALLKHEAIHKGDEPFKCNKCQSSFPQKSDLTEHSVKCQIQKPIRDVGQIYKCKDCPEAFVKKIDLLRHMCCHKGKKEINCTECDFVCTAKSVLDTHMIDHLPKKPVNQTYQDQAKQEKNKLKCSKCFEVFISKYQLQEHLEMHAGIRPFQCMECIKAFKRKVDLKNHAITAHGKSKKKTACKCHLCGSSFSYSSSLSRHHTKGRCQFYNNF